MTPTRIMCRRTWMVDHIPVVEVTHLRTSVMWCMGVELSVAHDAVVTVTQNKGMKEAMFAGHGAIFTVNRNLNGMRSVSVWQIVSQQISTLFTRSRCPPVV